MSLPRVWNFLACGDPGKSQLPQLKIFDGSQEAGSRARGINSSDCYRILIPRRIGSTVGNCIIGPQRIDPIGGYCILGPQE